MNNDQRKYRPPVLLIVLAILCAAASRLPAAPESSSLRKLSLPADLSLEQWNRVSGTKKLIASDLAQPESRKVVRLGFLPVGTLRRHTVSAEVGKVMVSTAVSKTRKIVASAWVVETVAVEKRLMFGLICSRKLVVEHSLKPVGM